MGSKETSASTSAAFSLTCVVTQDGRGMVVWLTALLRHRQRYQEPALLLRSFVWLWRRTGRTGLLRRGRWPRSLRWPEQRSVAAENAPKQKRPIVAGPVG